MADTVTAESAALAALPADALIVVPVRNFVLFPTLVLPLTIGRAISSAAAQQAAREGRPIGLVMQRNADVDEPSAADLHGVGTIANVLRYVTAPDGVHLITQGVKRFRVKEILQTRPFFAVRAEAIDEDEPATDEIEARALHLKSQAAQALELIPQAPPEMLQAVENAASPGALADLIAAFMDSSPAEKQDILETIPLAQRMDKVSRILAHRIEVLRLSRKIGEDTKATLDQRQREMLLREQLATIQKELGEGDAKDQEIAQLEEAIDEADMPADVEEQAQKEIVRLKRLPEASAEYGMARTYLDWLIELPWALPAPTPIDIAEARRVLDDEHYGLEKIKQRILEYLAVRKLAPGSHAPILCFAGPPGVGKTSLGQSIAHAMGRKFTRVSLGGVRDEAEIRGHRRTYIGALPGNIIQGIRKAGTRDCVMMLDEIDKMSAGMQGDPSAAMLEVLDPEQNATFRDAYLGVPFDLSSVVFIATANMLENIPGPLRDRMEVINLAGYTDVEKLEIAKRYLVRRQLERNGLAEHPLTFDDATLLAVIRNYTRESGVRNLEREIAKLMRSVAVRIAEGQSAPVQLGLEDVERVLGPPKFEGEVASRLSVPGVATGLAWTPVGGDILFIEASRSPGGGRLILTGQLGDVMRESAQAALSLVKASTDKLEIDPALLEKSDIHVHVPAGATPKDGPSAGVAMYIALTSLLTGKIVRNDTAMTGEISLRGLVLPVGGIKEKVIAAARAGLKRVMIPARNKRDLEDVPEDTRKQLEFVFLETVDDARKAALG